MVRRSASSADSRPGPSAPARDVGDDALRALLAAGYTRQNALEVVLGIGTYTMSTLANRLTAAPLDDALAPYTTRVPSGRDGGGAGGTGR